MDQFGGEEVLFLHVRRGDPNLTDKRGFKWAYVNLQDQHPTQPIEYYQEALTKELKPTEWVEVDIGKKEDKSQASIQ